MGLIEREPSRPTADAGRLQTAGAVGERAGHLVAAGALLPRDLGVHGITDHALGQPRPEASRHVLTSRHLVVGLGERPRAAGTLVARLAPRQPRHLSRHRQVAHPHPQAFFDLHLRLTAVRAAGDAGERLDLQLELLASPPDPDHNEPLQPGETSSVILQLLFLLALAIS